MQLMLAIVQNEDADVLGKRLTEAGFAFTRLHTFGGFLASGNVTILSAVEDERMDDALGVIRKTCRTRRRYINPMPAGAEPAHLALAAPAYPLEVLVGGATVFSVPISRSLRMQDRVVHQEGDQPQPSTKPGVSVMNLVLAILQSEDADPVTRALIAAGHRVTRINTAGGFLRRGNVTLLVGVEAYKVDDVLGAIAANCGLRGEAALPDRDKPPSKATVFVLETARFVHI